jgi:molybdate transport system permease protein
MDLAALGLTLRLAALTTAVLLVLGTPLALWLAERDTWPRRLVTSAALLPLVLPPTVLGFYLLEGLGPQTTLGRALTRLAGHPLAFTFGGLLLGSLVYSLPFAIQPLSAAFRAVDPNLRDLARSLGASPWQVATRVVLPLSRRAFLTAGLLTFCHTVGEFGVVLMLGGDIPGVTRTLSISLFDQVQEADLAAATHTALLLVAFSFLALLALSGRRRRATETLPG